MSLPFFFPPRIEQFFMVMVQNGGGPTVVHPTYEHAEREAQRLAQTFSDREVYVLAAIKSIRHQAYVTTDLKKPTVFGSRG